MSLEEALQPPRLPSPFLYRPYGTPAEWGGEYHDRASPDALDDDHGCGNAGVDTGGDAGGAHGRSASRAAAIDGDDELAGVMTFLRNAADPWPMHKYGPPPRLGLAQLDLAWLHLDQQASLGFGLLVWALLGLAWLGLAGLDLA